MATRRSLTSRGFTSVNAGVSSTNRFLKPPRVVGEYTTVAEDLRSTKNAVGPAAQPLRPRARVDTGGGGDGGNIDTSYQIGSRARASVRGSEASLETKPGFFGGSEIDSFGGITATDSASKSRATGIGIAGTVVDALTGGVSKPLTSIISGVAAYDSYKTNKELTQTFYGTPKAKGFFDKTLEEIEGLPATALAQIGAVPGNIVTGAQKGLNALTGLVTKAEPVNEQRKSRIERAEQSTINKNTRDIAASVQAEQQSLQQAKEAQQQQTIKDNRRRDKEGGGGGGGFSGFGGSGEFSGNESGTGGLST